MCHILQEGRRERERRTNEYVHIYYYIPPHKNPHLSGACVRPTDRNERRYILYIYKCIFKRRNRGAKLTREKKKTTGGDERMQGGVCQLRAYMVIYAQQYNKGGEKGRVFFPSFSRLPFLSPPLLSTSSSPLGPNIPILELRSIPKFTSRRRYSPKGFFIVVVVVLFPSPSLTSTPPPSILALSILTLSASTS